MIHPKLLIEVDGVHHFEDIWGGKLHKQVVKDAARNDFVSKNGVLLLRLHYLDCEGPRARQFIEAALQFSGQGGRGVMFSRKPEYQAVYGQYWNPRWEA